MIGSLRGPWEGVRPGEIIVYVSGIGFQVFIPETLLSSLPPREEITLSIYTYVREDQLLLYGFSHQQERELFKALLGVSRIGPSVSLKILSSMGVEDFVQAILTDNVDSLKHIPGIGKKTAQRMILELKTRLEEFALPQREGREGVPQELVLGLINLGYSASEAKETISKVMEKTGATDEGTILRLALKELAKS